MTRGRRAGCLVVAAVTAALAVALAGCDNFSAASSTAPPARAADPALAARASLAPCPHGTGSVGSVGGGLPGVRLPCLGGGAPVDLATLRGPAVVNIGWSGCEPCRREAPVLQRFYATAAGRVGLVGVDVEDPDTGLRFAISSGVHYPLLSDPHELVKDAGLVRAYPVSYFVDAAGRVVATRYHEYRSVAELRSDVRRLLGVALP